MQFNEWYQKEKDVVTGIVQRYLGRNVSINLGKVDAILNEAEQVKTEIFRATERIKVYVLEVKDTPKGPRISVSRTHPDLVKRLFEEEVTEVKDGTVEIKAIAREAGSLSLIHICFMRILRRIEAVRKSTARSIWQNSRCRSISFT